MPWVLGCGGCGLLIIIVLVLFGAALVRMAKEGAQGGKVSSDTTVVTSDTTASGKPTDYGTTETTSTDQTSTEKPSDASPPSDNSDEGLKEIRPVPADSTF
jgi:hypothetical protein